MVRNVTWIVCVVGALLCQAAEEPQVGFTITGGQGLTGQQVTSRVLIATDTDMQGWSFGVRWDTGAVSLIGAEKGGVVFTVNNGAPADFADFNIDPVNGPGITQGVVISFVQTAVLKPGSDYEVAVMHFRLDAEPVDQAIQTDVFFATDLGSPPVALTGVIGGASVTPTTQNGTLTINLPPEDCSVVDFTCESDPDNIYLRWGYLSCDGPRPFDFLLLYRENELLAELSLTDTQYDDLGLAPGTYTYTIAWVYWPASGGPITLDYVQCTADVIALLITSVEPKEAFLPGVVRNPVGDLVPGEITITGRGFTTVEDTTITIGDLAVEIIEIIGDNTIRAKIPCSSRLGTFDLTLVNSRGEVTVPQTFLYGWLRGDVRIDGILDLQDAIDILGYMFKIPGWKPLFCLDAADLNDDGWIDIADPVFATYMIAGIDPVAYRPPEPWTKPLVTDPTADSLDCGLVGFDCTNPNP